MQRTCQVLNMGGLGDRMSSALMCEMLTLMGNHQPCFEFTYLQQLPRDIRKQLAGESFEDPIRLAARADELCLFDQQQMGMLEYLEPLESPESQDRIESTPWQAQRPRTTPTRATGQTSGTGE